MEPPNPFVQQIIAHWRNNFPKQAAELDRTGEMVPTAESAAERSGLANEQALSNGLSWHQAQELSTELWGTSPNA
jgi:hypothetical protein